MKGWVMGQVWSALVTIILLTITNSGAWATTPGKITLVKPKADISRDTHQVSSSNDKVVQARPRSAGRNYASAALIFTPEARRDSHSIDLNPTGMLSSMINSAMQHKLRLFTDFGVIRPQSDLSSYIGSGRQLGLLAMVPFYSHQRCVLAVGLSYHYTDFNHMLNARMSGGGDWQSVSNFHDVALMLNGDYVLGAGVALFAMGGPAFQRRMLVLHSMADFRADDYSSQSGVGALAQSGVLYVVNVLGQPLLFRLYGAYQTGNSMKSAPLNYDGSRLETNADALGYGVSGGYLF